MSLAMPRLDGAACATRHGLKLFADITDSTITACRELCASCPVQAACLQWGVRHEHEGMWGGLLAEELQTERRRHGIRIKP